jgi:hypothetical protein
MVMTGPLDHQAFAEALRQCVLEGPGETDAALRRRVAARAAGGAPIEAPYDDLAHQIDVAAHRTTDAHIGRVLSEAGSEKAAFEVIAAAATGAGLMRWQHAVRVLREAADAPG